MGAKRRTDGSDSCQVNGEVWNETAGLTLEVAGMARLSQGRQAMVARTASMLFIVVASVLLALGLLAGVVNHEVLDGPRFARHMDAVRRDPAVAQQTGTAITNQVIVVAPDIVAVRPLLDAATTSLVSSQAFGPIFRASVRDLHATLTGRGSGQITLRLADAGAVLAGVLPTISPSAAAKVPPDLDVTLSRVGSGSFAARTVRLAHIASTLSWLLPVLALLAFAAGWWLAPYPGRRRSGRIAWAVTWSGVGVGLVTLAASVAIWTLGTDGFRAVVARATWRQFSGALWWTAAITVGVGVLGILALSGRLWAYGVGRQARRAAALMAVRPSSRPLRLLRGLALTLVGLLLALRPRPVLEVFAVLAGLVLLVAGVGEIGAVFSSTGTVEEDGPAADRPPQRRRWLVPITVGAAVAVLVALVAFEAEPANEQVPGAVGEPLGCNGFVALCNRPYNQVSFPATHNSMSAADEPGWFIPEQPDGLIGQLNAGIRVLLIDSWYGQTTTRPGLVATAPGSHAAALAEAQREYGAAAVESFLRLHNAIAPTATGAVLPYLCHSLCEIGSTEWAPVMSRVQAWLVAHPREVVTFFIEDRVSPADTATVFRQAGLLPYVYQPRADGSWPTLAQMIASGHRVVVLMENHDGGTTYPWLMSGFHWVQDTPFGSTTAADLSCAHNRGATSSPILLINYWLTNDYRSLVTDARAINSYGVLSPFVARCRQQRGTLPNYVAVNFYNEGDLFRVVDELNGVP